MHRLFALLVCALLAAACYTSTGSSPTPTGSASVTFHKDVEPILQQHCDGCHVSGGIAPFPLLTYQDAQPYAQDIAAQTTSRTMPPWGAQNTSECTTRSGFKEDPSLTDDQIKTISDWAAQGAAEGDIADAPPPFVAPTAGLDGVSWEKTPPAGFALAQGTSQDVFQCFVLDPGITATTYVNGTNIVPGNSLIVHHAVVFADPNRESLAKITDPSTQSYPCFAGPGLSTTSLVTAWAPGGMPRSFQSDVGMPLSPNTLLVMQIHYHPHSTDPHVYDADQTRLQLRYASATPTYFAINKLIGNFTTTAQGLEPGPTFAIPPDDASYTQTMVYTIPSGLTKGRPAHVYSIGGHMHLVGQDIKVSLERAGANTDGQNPSDECLLQIPAWNFDWQRQYDYAIDDIDAMPSIGAGDTLRVRCTYDNTMQNAQLAQELTAQGETSTHQVTIGESSDDEMCLAIMTVVVPAQ